MKASTLSPTVLSLLSSALPSFSISCKAASSALPSSDKVTLFCSTLRGAGAVSGLVGV
ncbi:Uncharacterised protein [Vibrio cholerae]|nr:Uncharacterised protein [Vibrio cholerae]